jgi:serine-type D-Ala-D-Ala carboxypeptidase (penicillin-binding protein 5/6)
VGVLALVLALLVVAIALRAATEVAPPVRVARTLALSVRAPGSAPAFAWPEEGEAAVQAQGVEGAIASSGRQQPVAIASVAKVMTAYLTLLAHPLGAGQQGFVMTVTPADVAEDRRRVALDESTLPVRAGERISEREALQALLLPSANNIAALLAAHEGGVTAFVAAMNAAARHLGMAATTYTDPSGFEPSTVSTAADQLKLARAAMGLPAFAAIVDERSVVLPVAGRVANYNALVGQDGYVGVKTGSDAAAGGCLVFAKRTTVAGRALTIMGVVLGQRSGALVEAALASAQRLGDSAASALRMESVLPAGSRVLSLSDADGRRTAVATAGALRTIAWGGLALPVSVTVGPTATSLPAGQRVASVSIGGSMPASTSAVAVHRLAGPSLGWRLSHLL